MPRKAGGVLAPLEMRFILHCIVDDILRLILNVARIIVDPRERHALAPGIVGEPGV
ncbi:MAG: hypothetical protein KIG59_07710 [Muribaculaceae bacterium]|nr:hypothetical protein [Muribaculaceae bacterium]